VPVSAEGQNPSAERRGEISASGYIDYNREISPRRATPVSAHWLMLIKYVVRSRALGEMTQVHHPRDLLSQH
jgi:hypothetical protein